MAKTNKELAVELASAYINAKARDYAADTENPVPAITESQAKGILTSFYEIISQFPDD